jgi:hypothetical protein
LPVNSANHRVFDEATYVAEGRTRALKNTM